MSADACGRGHPWTPENTYVGPTGYRACRRCVKLRQYNCDRGVRTRPAVTYGRVSDRIVAALHQHPAGLTVDRLRALLGYRQSPDSVRYELHYLRRRFGLPIVAVPEGRVRRYYLERGAA